MRLDAFFVETLLEIGFHTSSLMNSTYPSTIWDKSSASFARTEFRVWAYADSGLVLNALWFNFDRIIKCQKIRWFFSFFSSISSMSLTGRGLGWTWIFHRFLSFARLICLPLAIITSPIPWCQRLWGGSCALSMVGDGAVRTRMFYWISYQ